MLFNILFKKYFIWNHLAFAFAVSDVSWIWSKSKRRKALFCPSSGIQRIALFLSWLKFRFWCGPPQSSAWLTSNSRPPPESRHGRLAERLSSGEPTKEIILKSFQWRNGFQGTGCEMYTETLSPTFAGMTFSQASEWVFKLFCGSNIFPEIISLKAISHYDIQPCIIQGVFFHWYPPKKLKYGKPGLGESTAT